MRVRILGLVKPATTPTRRRYHTFEMNIRLSIIILIFSIVSCAETTTSENVTVLLNQSGSEWFRYGEMKMWKPNQADINIAENTIPKVIEDNKTDYDVKEIYQNIDDYYFQLVPYLDKNNRKIIYVNSLCKSFVENPIPNSETKEQKTEIEWKSHLFNVDDGYNCFWQVQLDIEKETYFDFSVNGI